MKKQVKLATQKNGRTKKLATSKRQSKKSSSFEPVESKLKKVFKKAKKGLKKIIEKTKKSPVKKTLSEKKPIKKLSSIKKIIPEKNVFQSRKSSQTNEHAVIFAQGNHTHSKEDEEPLEINGSLDEDSWETRDPTYIYLRELGYKPLLTPKEELRIAREVKKGSSAARVKMIESNLRLVVKIARHYCHRGLAFLDLIEEGNLGLMTAVEKFDPERGFRFSTYATWWIRQTIERAIMNQSRTVRLPIHVIKELNIYLRAGKKLAMELDHKPTHEEIAELIDKPVDEIREILALAPDTMSIDTPVMADSQKTLVDIIADENNVDPSDLVQQEDLEIHIKKWLDALNEREREVIVRRFGLLGHEHSTLEEVGEAVGLTRERVRQLQIEGLKKLRHILEAEGLTKNDSME